LKTFTQYHYGIYLQNRIRTALHRIVWRRQRIYRRRNAAYIFSGAERHILHRFSLPDFSSTRPMP